MRGVWKCRLRVFGRPLGTTTPTLLLDSPHPPVLLLDLPAPSLAPAGGGSSRLSAPWRVSPHTGVLSRYVLMAPVLKSFFIKIHCQHVKIRSFYVTAQRSTASGVSECTLQCRVHGARALEPGAPPVRGSLGRCGRTGTAPGSISHPEGALPGPDRSPHPVLQTGPKVGVSLHTEGRPRKEAVCCSVGVAPGCVQGLSPHCSGGSPAPEQQFVHKSVCQKHRLVPPFSLDYWSSVCC